MSVNLENFLIDDTTPILDPEVQVSDHVQSPGSNRSLQSEKESLFEVPDV